MFFVCYSQFVVAVVGSTALHRLNRRRTIQMTCRKRWALWTEQVEAPDAYTGTDSASIDVLTQRSAMNHFESQRGDP